MDAREEEKRRGPIIDVDSLPLAFPPWPLVLRRRKNLSRRCMANCSGDR
jgi:hypothetical protein